MEQLYNLLLGLRAIRSFEKRPVRDDHLQRILEAARWTGSSKNRQNWSVVVVRDPSRIERLAECGDFTGPVRAAPLTLALVREPEGYEFDTGRLAQNIMLAAAALGVASCPITLHREEDAARVLELPEGFQCRYAVAMGYPSPEARPARFGGRKPLADLTHAETHGR